MRYTNHADFFMETRAGIVSVWIRPQYPVFTGAAVDFILRDKEARNG